MYYLHTYLSYISIQPLLVFVGTTINKLLGPPLVTMPQNKGEVASVWLLNHIRAESPGKERTCCGILNLGRNKPVLITEDGIIVMPKGAAMCPVQPSKVLVSHGELWSPPTWEPLPDHGSLSAVLATQRL